MAIGAADAVTLVPATEAGATDDTTEDWDEGLVDETTGELTAGVEDEAVELGEDCPVLEVPEVDAELVDSLGLSVDVVVELSSFVLRSA